MQSQIALMSVHVDLREAVNLVSKHHWLLKKCSCFDHKGLSFSGERPGLVHMLFLALHI